VARVGALDLEGAVNFSLDDRHRSLRRFVMNALGSPPWVVRTERQPVQDDERPVAVVEVTSAVATTQARATLPQGDVRRTQTFTLTLYPVIEATAAESRQLAAQTAELLLQALGAGMSDDAGGVLSYPERIPVYDFQAVPVKGALRAGPADPYGHLTVEDYPVRPIQDPDDPLRWTVACDLRVSFWQAGRERPAAPVVTNLPPQPPGSTPPGAPGPLPPWPEPGSPKPPALPPLDDPAWGGRGVLEP
jgi:hypothetical protein